jgi:hypothetical protein
MPPPHPDDGWLSGAWDERALMSTFRSRARFHVVCRPDLPGGAAVTAVVVECNGAVVPGAVAMASLVNGSTEVTVPGLIPDTLYSLRCRYELEDPDVDPDSLWSPSVDVVTLGVTEREVGSARGAAGSGWTTLKGSCVFTSRVCVVCGTMRLQAIVAMKEGTIGEQAAAIVNSDETTAELQRQLVSGTRRTPQGGVRSFCAVMCVCTDHA